MKLIVAVLLSLMLSGCATIESSESEGSPPADAIPLQADGGVYLSPDNVRFLEEKFKQFQRRIDALELEILKTERLLQGEKSKVCI